MGEAKHVSEDNSEYDDLAHPPHVEVPVTHKMWPVILAAIKEVYDPEIPVNIYELGLIYKVEIQDRETDEGIISDLYVAMSLTSPACPVAQEMPMWIQGAILSVENIGDVDVEIVWDPTWDPSMMAETAKMQLNMFI